MVRLLNVMIYEIGRPELLVWKFSGSIAASILHRRQWWIGANT